MEHEVLLNDLAICIVAAWIVGVVAQLLKQPLILAYLLAGFLIGPFGVGLVKSQASIEVISRLGLILLLFMIGLEIDLKKILSAGRLIIVVLDALYLGLGLALSSSYAGDAADDCGSEDATSALEVMK